MGWPIDMDLSHPFMTMILTSGTMVEWADVPDSDRVTSDVCVPSTYLVYFENASSISQWPVPMQYQTSSCRLISFQINRVIHPEMQLFIIFFYLYDGNALFSWPTADRRTVYKRNPPDHRPCCAKDEPESPALVFVKTQNVSRGHSDDMLTHAALRNIPRYPRYHKKCDITIWVCSCHTEDSDQGNMSLSAASTCPCNTSHKLPDHCTNNCYNTSVFVHILSYRTPTRFKLNRN